MDASFLFLFRSFVVMHILEIPSFFHPYGGLFCLDQAKALAALGHEVRILSNVQLGLTIGFRDYCLLPYRRYEHVMDGITVCQSYQRGLPKYIRYNVRRWVSIVRSMFDDYVARYGTPDILHAHCAKWAGYTAMTISEDCGIPFVITEHLPLMWLEYEFGKPPSRAWQVPLLRRAYERADRVLPVSEELVEATAPYYGKDYKWQYISNTIDTAFFACQPRPAREGRSFRFCCLADYSTRKGYDVLFAAYQRLARDHPALELHIAGFMTDSVACKAEVKRLGLRNVSIYGKIDKQSVRDLLYRCDALVLASRSEVQPLVLLEAMSTGIPVISTECIPRCLRLGDGCHIVPVADVDALARTMATVMSNPAPDGRALSEKVWQMASPQVVGRKIESVFNDILSSR